MRKNLDEVEFEAELEECIAKIKWDMMSQDEKGGNNGNKEDQAYTNIMEILSEDEKEEVEEWEEYQEALRRVVYHPEEKSCNYGRKRATDLKGNIMVVMPGRRKKFSRRCQL